MTSNAECNHGACEKFEALLEDFLHGSLACAEAKNVAKHLNQCDGCRGAFEDAAASARLLHAAEPTADPGLGFSRMVMARIRTAEQGRVVRAAGFWQPFVPVGWTFAATATLALGVLLTYGAGWAKRPQPNVASTRPTVVHDMFSPEPAGAPANADELQMLATETNHGHR
jgi:hypothetical protein